MAVKCVICEQVLKQRTNFLGGYGAFPENHQNPQTKNICHGYFKEGVLVKLEGEDNE